jgi:hypothetical protein
MQTCPVARQHRGHAPCAQGNDTIQYYLVSPRALLQLTRTIHPRWAQVYRMYLSSIAQIHMRHITAAVRHPRLPLPWLIEKQSALASSTRR